VITRQEKARRKLLKLATRQQLEDMSQMSRPWLADIATLTEAALWYWSADDVSDIVKELMRVAG
jgi:hypothetical protein